MTIPAADDTINTPTWVWPSNEEINDFPDPLGFEREWREWDATMAEGPSVHAEIFAREYLQNSWDSIQDQIAALAAEGAVVPEHGVEFRFVRLQGSAATDFVSRFGLDGHIERYGGMGEKHRSDNRLGESELIAGDTSEITLLVAREICGHGMFGPWKTGGRAGVVSRLRSALMQTKSDKNNDAAGGSWGHGKKAIANASSCRTIAVYTCFEEDTELDPGVTKRLLGVTYWKSHDLGEFAHVGLGLLGRSTDASNGAFVDGFRPLQNQEADQFVERLGIPGLQPRSADDPTQLGTTYLIVEPAFSPADLASALERNWWPLLHRKLTTISVVDYEGAEIELSPGSREELIPFLQAGNLALGLDNPRDRGDDVDAIHVSGTTAGTLALTSDDSPDGWSYADPENNRTLVALVRNDMVIAYERFPRKQRQKGPYLRGVLIVDRVENGDASELLKMSEPHLHNVWQTEPGPSVPKDAADFAAKTLAEVQGRVGRLRSSLKEDDQSIATHFPVFSQLFAEGRSPTVSPPPPPPPSPPRPFHISGASDRYLDSNFEDPTLIRFESTVSLSLTERQLERTDRLKVLVKPGWRVLEERGPVRDDSLLDRESIVVPNEFIAEGDGFVGYLNATPQSFTWASEFFPDDWRVAPDPAVTVVELTDDVDEEVTA